MHRRHDSKDSQGYEAVNTQEPGSPTSQAHKMTRPRALSILGLDKTATAQERKTKFDQEMQDYLADPLSSDKTPEQIEAMAAAKDYLDKIEQHKLPSPIDAIMTRQHKKGQRAIKAFQELCQPYFTDLTQLATDIDTENRTYLSDKNIIGGGLKEKYGPYQQKVQRLTQTFNARPELLSAEVITTLLRTMIAENIAADQEKMQSLGGPLKAAKAELIYVTKTKEGVLEKITFIQTGLSKLEARLIEINKTYTQKLSTTQNKSDISALDAAYKATLRKNITEPLQKLLGNTPEATAAIKTLVKNFVLDMDSLGDLHLSHQAFLAKLEHSTDPRIAAFLEQYEDYSQILARTLNQYPQFEQKLSGVSNEFYKLGTQFLLAIQQPDADIDALTLKLNQRLEFLILKVNEGFHNSDSQDYSENDRAWTAAWTMLMSPTMDLFSEIHIQKSIVADPLVVFKDSYNNYAGTIIALQDQFTIPEHQAVLIQLEQDISKIGQEYFSALKMNGADVDALSQTYQENLNQALTKANTAFENAGAEKSEIWPQLHPIIQILATIVFFVKWHILSEDAKIPERNRTFHSEKSTFKTELPNWLEGIQELNQERYAQHNARFRDNQM